RHSAARAGGGGGDRRVLSAGCRDDRRRHRAAAVSVAQGNHGGQEETTRDETGATRTTACEDQISAASPRSSGWPDHRRRLSGRAGARAAAANRGESALASSYEGCQSILSEAKDPSTLPRHSIGAHGKRSRVRRVA